MGSKGTVWVTGAKGYMGTAISHGLEMSGYKVVGTDSELSLGEPERLEAFAIEVHPDVIVNCAGIKREATTLHNKALAYEVNALGARNVALVANAIGALMVQVSTDNVYSSHQAEPVNEFDMPHPDTPYGKSKRAGEFMVRDTTPDHLIIRSSWVYEANHGKLKEILDAAKRGAKCEARTDHFTAPASIALYMKYLLKMLDKGARGTYHIAPTGKTSRYDLAVRFLRNAGFDPSAILVPANDPQTAEDIVLESLMLEMAGAHLPTWEEDLHHYMDRAGLLA